MNLRVDDMDFKCPGISEGINSSFKEAIKVCLEINKHPQGKLFVIDGEIVHEFNILWEPATQQLHDAWMDHQETLETGACAIAVHIILHHTDYTVKKRSWKGTGFDYWLGVKNAESDALFQNVGKLEVSGIAEESETNTVDYRVNRKIKQIDKFKNQYPAQYAYIVVVEFASPKSHVYLKND